VLFVVIVAVVVDVDVVVVVVDTFSSLFKLSFFFVLRLVVIHSFPSSSATLSASSSSI